MNGNFSFNVISAGQQCNPLIQPIAYQTQLPVNQNVQFLPNMGQPMSQLAENFILNQQFQTNNGVTYCSNQNGMTFYPQPQCFQAIETAQGLQLFQVITTPSIPSYPTENLVNQTQVFQPEFVSQGVPNVQFQDLSPVNNTPTVDSTLESYRIKHDVGESELPDNDQVEENKFDSAADDSEDYEECFDDEKEEAQENLPEKEESSHHNFETSQSVMFSNDRMSIPTAPVDNNVGVPQPVLVEPNVCNAQTFQILVNTPQGMVIQTVLASYPPPVMPLMTNNSMSYANIPQFPTNGLAGNKALSDVSMSHQCSTVPIKPCASPQSELLPVNGQCCPVPESSVLVPKEISTTSPPLVPLPVSSPHYLPDSTEDLCQATIKQSTSSIIDGIDLEDIREFARNFKMRRLVLGLTQTQVGQALSATEGPAYSQSAICRFEKLDITPRSAMKIRPVLETWLKEAEEKQQDAQHTGFEYFGSVLSAVGGKIRKRRTFFSSEALLILNTRFERNSHPSGNQRNLSVLLVTLSIQFSSSHK